MTRTKQTFAGWGSPITGVGFFANPRTTQPSRAANPGRSDEDEGKREKVRGVRARLPPQKGVVNSWEAGHLHGMWPEGVAIR